jgi:WD40 repeat protein
MTDRRPWRMRVRRAGGGVAGAGVLIDQRHVLTCAHVVDQALGRGGQDQQLPPAGEVEVDFVESQAGPLGAWVVEGGWVPVGLDGGGDVAVLKLTTEAPADARPAVLRRPPRLRGHHFDTYGYPRRYDTGLGATGVLAGWGGPANQWVELQGVEVPGRRVEGGFSGAAVYDQDARAVVGMVVAEDKLAEAKLAWMLPVRTLIQLLEPSWPRIAAIVHSSSMYYVSAWAEKLSARSTELSSHWSPKARGVERDAKRGWYFTGRTNVLRELTAWLAGGQADGQVRVVTGGPGSGKSAVLARLITLSDPLYREHVPDLDPTDPSVPPASSIDVAVWARAKTIDDVVAAIAQATELDVDSPDALINGLLDRELPCTVVVDALDEAVEPTGIAGKLLRPLAADGASVGVRVLVGSRPGREDDLVAALGRDAVRLDLDQPPYLEREDLVEFVARRLLLADDVLAPTPYRDKSALAGRVAAAVAARAYPTFLVAQLTSKALVQADRVVDVEAPGWELAFPGSVADAMDGYLDRLAEDAPNDQERRARKRRLRELLTPLAYAEGEGLPGALWPVAASALAERHYGVAELEWLLDTAADYLVEQATAEGGPVYRLYHEALADYLRPASLEETARHRRLATALLDTVPRPHAGITRDWSAARPYLTRHLATHAAVTGLLDQLLDDPGFLLAADPARLLRALPAASTPAARHRASVYRLAVHQLRDRPIEEAAAYLELAAHQRRIEDLAERIAQLGLPQPWSTVWAAWEPTASHYIIGRQLNSVRAVALGELDGRLIAVTGGDDDTLRVWDLREGTGIGEPLDADSDGIWAVALGELDGRPMAVTGGEDATVRVWDLREGTAIGEPLTGHTGPVEAVALGELDGRPIAVSGSTDATVRIWDLREGTAVVEPLDANSIGAVALGELDGRPIAVTGGDDDTVWLWDLGGGAPIGEPLTGYTEGIRAVALGELDGRPIAVIGGQDAMIWVWDLREGTAIGEPFDTDDDGIWAVALGELDGRPIAISGGWDNTVRVWDLREGAAIGEPLTGHTDTVDAVAFGELDGRPVAVSGSRDCTVRVWDLDEGAPTGQAFSTGLSPLDAVALAELDGRQIGVTGGWDYGVRVWDLREGALVGEPLTGHTAAITAVALGKLNGRPIVVSGDHGHTVRVWSLSEGAAIGEPFTDHTEGIEAVALGELDGRPIAVTGSNDRTVRLWDLREGAAIGEPLTGHTGPVGAVALGELDGRPIAVTGSGDDTVRLWDLREGAAIGEPLTGHTGWVEAVALGELDGRPIAVTGSNDRTVRLWDLREGAAIGEPLTGHTETIRAVALGELDGRPIVASGGWDNTVQMWDVAAGRGRVADMGAPISAIVHTLSGIMVGTSRGFVLLKPMWLE